MHLAPPMVLAAVLAGAGVYGVLARRNAVLVLVGLELILNSANLLLVTFDTAYGDQLHGGQVLAIFVVTIAAAEVGLALAVVMLLFRRRGDVDLSAARDLGEASTAVGAVDQAPAAAVDVR
ncbi:NADH-quinone oxidoreductase subunit NuoK [Angustibacter sp. McL0619]|uniref:NADH-quinone oxidoreductase subunit NuoK n=1 Tax=Angustibacter sp. McL0619 TaxID=3415676 RepID=UPI003CF78ADF